MTKNAKKDTRKAPEMTDKMKNALNKLGSQPAGQPPAAPGPVTPEKERERILYKNAFGELLEGVISDRTVDGKYTKLDGEWKETKSIQVVHKFPVEGKKL